MLPFIHSYAHIYKSFHPVNQTVSEIVFPICRYRSSMSTRAKFRLLLMDRYTIMFTAVSITFN